MVFNGKACARLCAGDAFLRCHCCGTGIAEIAFHLYAKRSKAPLRMPLAAIVTSVTMVRMRFPMIP